MAGTTNYPSALDSHTGGDPYGFAELVNLKSTTLSASLTSSATTISVVSTSGFPTRGIIVIGTGRSSTPEIVTYTGTSGGTQFTGCTRGAGGSTAAAHILGETVAIVMTAAAHDDLAAALVAVETVLGSGIKAANGVPRALGGYVSTGGVSQVDFTNVSQSYGNLRVAIQSFNGSAPANILMRFTTATSTAPTFDTATNYAHQAMSGVDASATGLVARGSSSILVGRGGVGSSGFSSPSVVHIPAYTSTIMTKSAVVTYGGFDGTATGTLSAVFVIGHWNNQDAIRGVRLIPASGNFGVGSQFTLYGEPLSS